MKTIQYCLGGSLILAAAFIVSTPAWADYPNFPDVCPNDQFMRLI
jgi:hypothetical protein